MEISFPENLHVFLLVFLDVIRLLQNTFFMYTFLTTERERAVFVCFCFFFITFCMVLTINRIFKLLRRQDWFADEFTNRTSDTNICSFENNRILNCLFLLFNELNSNFFKIVQFFA